MTVGGARGPLSVGTRETSLTVAPTSSAAWDSAPPPPRRPTGPGICGKSTTLAAIMKRNLGRRHVHVGRVARVGEMRDRDSITIAITAAETGYLALSTLHTGAAPQTISRILDIKRTKKTGVGKPRPC